MSSRRIAIVGAGPAGSSLAILCARDGMDVDLFEGRKDLERNVGESLLPHGHRMWTKLGLQFGDVLVKRGAVFFVDGQCERIDFSESGDPAYATAFQVDRAVLDEKLLVLAREAGAKVLSGHVRTPPSGYDWVVDATGRRRSLARGWTSFRRHPLLSNIAYGTHYRGARLPAECLEGDIAVAAHDDMWFWMIPLGSDILSVGVILTPGARSSTLDEALLLSPILQAALANAQRVGKVRGYADYSEKAEEFCGPGWALVGDAALFLDPVFSSGVLFAMEGADRLHQVVSGQLTPFDYQLQMEAAAGLMQPVVEAFYQGNFFELLRMPRESQSPAVRSGLVGLLSGNVFSRAGKAEKAVARQLQGIVELVRSRDESSPSAVTPGDCA